MKSIIFVFISSLVLTVLMTASNSETVIDDFCKEFETDKLSCSCSSKKNIEFCVLLRQIIEPDGSKILVNNQIRNMDKDSVTVLVRGPFEHLNYIEITELNGNRLLSKKEAYQLAQEKLPPNKRVFRPEIASAPFEYTLNPGEFLRSEYNLDDFFDLQSRVDYKFSFGRNIDISGQRNEENVVTIMGQVKIGDK